MTDLIDVAFVSFSVQESAIPCALDALDGIHALDGKRIAFVVAPPGAPAQCELALMSIDGTREKTLIPAGQPCMGPAAWSPDGGFLIVTGDTGHRVMDVATTESWPLHDDVNGSDIRSGCLMDRSS